MSIDAKQLRKVLLTAVVAALATVPGASEAFASNCQYQDSYGALTCNDGSQIYVCTDSGGCDAISCGQGFVVIDC